MATKIDLINTRDKLSQAKTTLESNAESFKGDFSDILTTIKDTSSSIGDTYDTIFGGEIKTMLSKTATGGEGKLEEVTGAVSTATANLDQRISDLNTQINNMPDDD